MRDAKSGTEGEIGSSMGDDSGWTTETSTSMSEEEEDDDDEEDQDQDQDGRYQAEQAAELSDTEEDEEEDRMTVPLMPFNHAVGGHSSIYKFTRRAVCKVSPTLGDHGQDNADPVRPAACQSREPVL